MAATSIPKLRLIELIIKDLQASAQAVEHFRIKEGTRVADRLMAFTKDELLTFILGLGSKAEISLNRLKTEFPLRRPPTLYLAIVENPPILETLLLDSHALSKLGRDGGIAFGNQETIRFVYLPQESVRNIYLKNIPVIEYELHYEHRFEYVQAETEADNYAELLDGYSLETAFVWLPLEKHSHAVIACSDYPALRLIRYFMQMKLGIELTPPFLSREMLEKITKTSVPRSITYSLDPFIEGEGDVQNITLADPELTNKRLFHSVINNPNLTQTAGFYLAHQGLALGGIGVARRDGKIWTPKRLDRGNIAELSLAIIEQTEEQLAQTDDLTSLAKHFFAHKVKIGGKELKGKAKETWVDFIPRVLEVVRDRAERPVPPQMINRLVRDQKNLKLLTTVEFPCNECGIQVRAKCPEHQVFLEVTFYGELQAVCPVCKRSFSEQLSCECGAIIDIDELARFTRIFPESDFNKSLINAAKKCKLDYQGIWGIVNLTLHYLEPRQQYAYPRLNLGDFRIWRNQGQIDQPVRGFLSTKQLRNVMNKTKEKCLRDGTRESKKKCGACIVDPLRPEWIKHGETCLLRLFGVPIGQRFDGIHHGHEVADLLYSDYLLNTGQPLRLGIHVKSRYSPQPAKGVGRSIDSIEGLYKQVVFSTFDAAVRGEDLQVIGIAMPNRFKDDVVDSLAYAVNMLGFSFVVVDESTWEVIIDRAYEQSMFDRETE